VQAVYIILRRSRVQKWQRKYSAAMGVICGDEMLMVLEVGKIVPLEEK
jgi:hypothetical protein